VRDTQIQK